MNSIAEFEALVLSQKPADKPWEPVLAYDIETRRAIEGRQPWLIRDVFRPESVLDYGCGAGFLVAFLSEIGVKVQGYEPSKAMIDRVPHYVEDLIRDSCWSYRMNDYSAKGYWDLVICREVLEHLTVLNIKKTIADLCRYAKRYVYVTTRFHLAPRSVFDVATSDDLDPTHISMCHKDFLRMLFVLEGFKCRPDLESKMDWQQKGRVLVYERA
jgi:SAM-dependent methyltransferase